MCFHGDPLVINSLEGIQGRPAFSKIGHHWGSIPPRATPVGKLTCMFSLGEGHLPPTNVINTSSCVLQENQLVQRSLGALSMDSGLL